MNRLFSGTAALLFSAACAASNATKDAVSLDFSGNTNLSCRSVIDTHTLMSGSKEYRAAIDFNDANSEVAPGLLNIRLPTDPDVIFVTVAEPVACGEDSKPSTKWTCETFGCTEDIFGTGHMAPGTQLSMETCGDGGKITITWTKNPNGSWTVTSVSAEQHTSCGPMD